MGRAGPSPGPGPGPSPGPGPGRCRWLLAARPASSWRSGRRRRHPKRGRHHAPPPFPPLELERRVSPRVDRPLRRLGLHLAIALLGWSAPEPERARGAVEAAPAAAAPLGSCTLWGRRHRYTFQHGPLELGDWEEGGRVGGGGGGRGADGGAGCCGCGGGAPDAASC